MSEVEVGEVDARIVVEGGYKIRLFVDSVTVVKRRGVERQQCDFRGLVVADNAIVVAIHIKPFALP